MPLLAGLAEVMPWVHQWHGEYDDDWGGIPAEEYQAYLDEQRTQHRSPRTTCASGVPRPPAAARPETKGDGVTETYLRDVLDIPESVHAGDFKVELAGGFTEHRGPRRRVRGHRPARQAPSRKALVDRPRRASATAARTPPTCTARSAPVRATS